MRLKGVRPAGFATASTVVLTACVYYNAMYDTKEYYGKAVDFRRDGRAAEAQVEYDSVISTAGRLVADHPESKHAAPAALLKARAELARGNLWESLVATASGIPALTDDPAMRDVAAGFEGIGRRYLEQVDEADRLLTRAIEGDLSDEDRALFHFHRGLARLAAGRPEAAAADLEVVGGSTSLSPEVRLDLARGLLDVGQIGEAVRLSDQLVRENRFANFAAGMRLHLDTLVRRSPLAVDSIMAAQLAESGLTPQKRAALHYYRGFAQEVGGDWTGAIAEYDSARAGATLGRATAEASYRSARLRMIEARTPADIVATREILVAARAIPDTALATRAIRLSAAVAEFTSLVEAYETRGSTAAEAALRGAEIAGADLGARRVARGLYLTYLDLSSDSRWDAKAMAGALLYADSPAGAWASDQGPSTDARLASEMASLPPGDPYRVSLLNTSRDAEADSAYVELERALQRRLTEIRMLYDTTAVFVAPTDTVPEADEAEEAADPTRDVAEE